MAFPQGINFRGSSGYATDGANEDKELATSANYPRTSAQGNTVGWEDAPDGSNNRDNSVNDRLRGGAACANGSTPKRYRVDLSSTGDWKIRLGMCDAAGATNLQYAELFDTTTSLGVLADKSLVGYSNAVNEANSETSPSAWASNYSSSGVTKTFSTTVCRIKVGKTTGGFSSWISHFYLEFLGSSGPAIPVFMNQYRQRSA